MTDPRKPIFDAVKAISRPGLFNDSGNILALDNLLDAFNVPRAGQAASAPARDHIPEASNMVGGDPIPAGYFDLLAKIESGARPYIKANTSSASGLFQFIRSTWRGEGGAWGGDMSKAFGGLKPSIEEQEERARSFTMKNVDVLQNARVPVNSATLYASHFLGVGTAIKMLRAPLDAVAADYAGDDAARANPSILGRPRTVAQFRNWLERKTGVRP